MNHCRADTELRLRIERIKQRLESAGQVCAPSEGSDDHAHVQHVVLKALCCRVSRIQ